MFIVVLMYVTAAAKFGEGKDADGLHAKPI